MQTDARTTGIAVERAGGAYVRRAFPFNGKDKPAGSTLTAEEVRKIPRANLNALVSTGRLELWPAAPGTAASVGGDRFLVHVGGGKYHVVQGVKLTEHVVSRAEAEAIAEAPSQTEH